MFASVTVPNVVVPIALTARLEARFDDMVAVAPRHGSLSVSAVTDVGQTGVTPDTLLNPAVVVLSLSPEVPGMLMLSVPAVVLRLGLEPGAVHTTSVPHRCLESVRIEVSGLSSAAELTVRLPADDVDAPVRVAPAVRTVAVRLEACSVCSVAVAPGAIRAPAIVVAPAVPVMAMFAEGSVA